jgi:DNA uptake protein ComE-like DNA-binding protein
MKSFFKLRVLAPVTLAIALVVSIPAPRTWADTKTDAAATLTKKPAALVDINTATEEELEAVSGIGPSSAKKIIASRPYASLDELSKTGIPAKTLAKFTPLLTVKVKPGKAATSSAKTDAPKADSKTAAGTTAAPAALVDINTATESQLEEVSGIGPATAKKIIANRPYATVKDLSKAGISSKTLAKITPLVTASVVTASADKPVDKAASSKSSVPMTPVSPGSKVTPSDKTTTPDKTSGTTTDKPADKTADSTTTKPAKTPRKPVQARTPPEKGMVWVNKDTKVYHVEGDYWYGKTKTGDWMTEADAVKAGYRKSK